LHEDLLPGEHGRLHSRFADAIDADHSLVPPGRAAIEMAHHWHSAHDTVWALIGAWQAVAQADRAVAPAERLSLLARVLELWDQVPDAEQRIGADHARVLEEATSAAHEAGEFERGIALANSALKELDPATEPVRVAQLLETRGHFKMNLGRKEFPEDFSAALQIVPADALAARVTILLSAARCVPHGGHDRSYAEEALALARQIGDEASEASALLALAMSHAGAGQQSGMGSDPIELIGQARAMAERTGAHDLLVKAAINESHLLEGAGEHELAAEAARRGLSGSDGEYVARAARSLLTINQVEPLLALGRWDEAARLVDEARDFQLASLPLHWAELRVLRGRIVLARGDTRAATEAMSEAAELLRGAEYDDQYQFPFGTAEIMLRLAVAGPAAGIETAAKVIDGYELSGGSPRYAWPLVAAAAGACLDAARQAAVTQDERLRDEVSALAERLRTIAEKLETSGRAQEASRLTFAAADAQAAGLLTAFRATSGHGGLRGTAGGLLGARAAEVRAAWARAAAAWAAVGEPYPLAQSLLHAAEVAVACGDRDDAAESLRRAAGLAAGLGAAPLSEEIAILARRARIRLPGAGDDLAAGRYAGVSGSGLGLTERELEVLRLVAAGRSNREVAAELFISPKTASVHVSNILAKLGAASRGQAAAKAHALRLFEPA
jgi:DNA-binding CsgD family transcriptional regulator